MYKTMCLDCKHYSEDDEGQPFCEAFGTAPPPEIFQDGFDHRQPYPGDNDIQFEPGHPVDVKFLQKFDQAPAASK